MIILLHFFVIPVMRVVPDMASILEFSKSFGKLYLLPFGCRASSGSAIFNLLESSFPGIGSDGLRMNRLFACGVGNESVCCVVDMQAKVLLL